MPFRTATHSTRRTNASVQSSRDDKCKPFNMFVAHLENVTNILKASAAEMKPEKLLEEQSPEDLCCHQVATKWLLLYATMDIFNYLWLTLEWSLRNSGSED